MDRTPWPPELAARLEALLARAHGRRASRRLDLGGLGRCVEEARASPWGHAWRHAGEVGDPRAFTTVCLAVVRAGEVVLGVAGARAQDVTPERAWPQLRPWRQHEPSANVAALQRWARTAAPDRLRLPGPAASRPAPDAAALLEQIRTHPGDDQARQVYGDRLLERGEPRGQLIALQLARPGSEAQARALEAEAEALLAAHQHAWLGPLAGAPARYERGFLHRLTLGPGQAPLAAALLEREPVHTVVAQGARAALEVAASGWLAMVRGLEVVAGPGRLDAAGLERLLGSPFLAGLEQLRLAGQPLGDAGLALLARSLPAALPRLGALALEAPAAGPSGLEALLGSPGLRRLEALALVGWRLGGGAAARLAGAPGPLALRTLRLEKLPVGDAGARALAGSARLPALEALALRRALVGPAGARALLEAPGLRGLRALDLEGNPVGAAAERALAERFGAGSRGPPPPW